jgi:hypothetical protein
MAKITQIKNPYNINANIIVSNNATISNDPELETIYNASSLSSGIILSNNSYFMENFSQIDNIIQLAAPITFGNTMFNTAAPITVCLFGDDNPLLFNDKTIPYIDEGKSYTGHSSIAEVHNFGNQPVSNENINTTISRSDGGVFDIPQVSPRGMRKIPLTSGDTVCCTSGYTYDRINYNWLFGNNAGINFNPIKSGATPTLLSGASISQEGCATISNQNGELLFYTNGETVYNSGNTIMSNGTGLSSSGTSTQSSIIVPKPDSNKYYIFTTDFSENPDGFEYSIVNMDAADGLGQVEAKNIKLISGPVSEKVTACNHTNCNDFWVITHTSGDSTFYTYKLSSSGLAPGPVTSIGSVHSTARGYMKTSIDGKKLVSLLYDEDIIDIFDFEASAGTISNAITITGFTFDVGPYGLEFSSDSSKIYVSDGAGEKINQFDITYTSATDMVNYAIEVASVPGASLGALQMGPDEKIYVADKDKDYLHVIHRPDGLGVQCNFQEKDFSLTGISSGITSAWGLPNNITTKDLSCDRYMYISDRNRPSFEFDFVFNDVSNVIQPKKLDYRGILYQYDSITKEFSNDKSLLNISILHNNLSADTTSKVTIPINTIDEGEYILKNYFNFPILTLISNQLGYTRSTFPNYERGSEYGLYDPERDWYFLNMFKADIPVLSITDGNAVNSISNLTVTSQFTDGINSRFYYDSPSSPLAALNGGVLANNIEYTAITSGITSYIQMSFTPVINQILTMAFVSNGSTENIYIDYYQVTSPISYGPINEQSESDKVYHNTTTSEFEYYLDMPYIGIPILVVNGNVLSYGIDWLLSTSNNKRIISLVDFVVGDLIETFYVPSTVVYGDLGNNTPVLSWSINNAPKIGYGGKFTIEFAAEEDTNFDTILYSKDVDHIIDQRSYTSSIDLTAASAGDKFIYRIKNEKTYESINGKILTSESVSNSYNVTVSNNFGEAY